MTAPLFSVLIDTFNYGKYIEEAVRSVLQQDFPAEQTEILVIDDGSTDDTEKRLEQFGDAIRYLKKANGGQASAFNLGLQHARGEFIAMLDADDVWLPNKLSRTHQAFVTQPDAGMVYHRLYPWVDSGRDEGEIPARDHFIAISGRVPDSRFSLLCYPMLGTSSLVFRRRAIQDLLPVPEVLRTQADTYLTALIIFICPVTAVDEYLAKYRIHGANLFHGNADSLSRSRLENRIAMRRALTLAIEEWLCERGIDTRSANIRDYLKQWEKAQEIDRYALEAPSRVEYFRHLSEYPALYRELMSRRQIAYNYLRAFAALILGYRHLHYFDEFYTRWWKSGAPQN
jgi:glycosyltransferase involved in cell wall biosynthesis